MQAENDGRWWGQFQLPLQAQGRWQVGALDLLVSRQQREWLFQWRHDVDPDWERLDVVVPGEGLGIESPFESRRFLLGETSPVLHLQPLLAQRSVVVRPEAPVYVAPGETVVLYITTPLWLQLAVEEPPAALTAIPTARVAETWFGANTREGFLCFAGRLPLRHSWKDAVRYPGRAITPLVITNAVGDALVVERVRLPLPRLPLLVSNAGVFWTPAVTVHRSVGETDVSVSFGDGAPPEAGPTRDVAPAQLPEVGNLVLRALGSIFNG